MVKQQQGMTMISTVLVLIILGLVFMFGLRLFPLYFDYYAVKDSLQEVANEVGSSSVAPLQVWRKMEKHLAVNSIDYIDSDALTVNRGGDGNELVLEYDARTSYLANIDLVAHFRAVAKPQ